MTIPLGAPTPHQILILRFLYLNRGEHSASGKQISCCRGLAARGYVSLRKGPSGRGSFVAINDDGAHYLETKHARALRELEH